jgi:mRNA interferase MazF
VVGGANNLTVVVPLTTTLTTARFSHTHHIAPTPHNGLDSESIALVFQIVALDRDRFRDRIGSITEQQRRAITELIKDLLNLD